MSMRIYIPTRGRVQKQVTWKWLPAALRKRTIFVCPPAEAAEHQAAGRPVLERPVSGLANVRQWLLEWTVNRGEKKICLVDDDLTFSMRKVAHDRHQCVTPPDGMMDMFQQIEKLLDEYPIVGVSQTSHNDSFIGAEFRHGLVLNRRICALFGIRTDIMTKEQIRFDAVTYMSDLHAAISFLEHGYQTALITRYMWRQNSNAPGGCSIERTREGLAEAALHLRDLHPGVVRLRSKVNNEQFWYGKDGKIDVTIDWQKAVAVGQHKTRRKLF